MRNSALDRNRAHEGELGVHRECTSSVAAVSLDGTMPTRKLSPAEENEARKAFAMLQNKKLLTVNKRGRPASMAPVHAALAIRKGAFAKNRGASLSAELQLTAAALAYGGVPAKKIKEYIDLLVQCDAPESGARLLQTPLAARERLRRRAARVGLELADMTADGNCFYSAVAYILIDLGVRSVGYRHSDVRRDLADTLDTHRDESLDGGITLASAALLATHDWRRPRDLAEDAIWQRPEDTSQAAFPCPPPPLLSPLPLYPPLPPFRY